MKRYTELFFDFADEVNLPAWPVCAQSSLSHSGRFVGVGDRRTANAPAR